MGTSFTTECGCGERVKPCSGKVFVGEGSVPTRTCLPQVDPLPSHRLSAVRAEGVFYEAEVVDKTGKRGSAKRLASGWPIDLPHVANESEEYTRYYEDLTNVEAQVLEAIQEHIGPEAEQLLYTARGDDRWQSFAEAERAFFSSTARKHGFPKPGLSATWFDDREAARVRLTGSMTGVVKQLLRVDHLPTGFNLKDADVVGRLGQYTSFKEACAAGRVYVVDYSAVLRPVVSFGLMENPSPPPPPEDEWGEPIMPPPPSPNVLANPVMLLFMEGNGMLLPIGIKLFNNPPQGYLVHNPLYTPDDSVWAWTMAKLYFNQAEVHYHVIGVLAVQVVLVAAVVHCMVQRALSAHHPLRQLLRPHLTGCLPFAVSMMKTFLCSGLATRALSLTEAGVQDLACSAYMRYDFANHSFKHEWRERMREASDLPADYYKDDGLLWWGAIEDFVRSVVGKYYSRPEDIEDDTELRELVRDMSNRLTRVKEIHPCRPTDSVVFNLTTIIYNTSANYAAKTRGIYDSYACYWAFPMRLHGVPLVDKPKDMITEEDVIAMLPNKRESLLQVGLAYVLSEKHHPTPADVPAFKGCDDFVDKASNKFEKKLQEDLKTIAEAIDARNASLEFPFTHLHPHHSVRPSFGSF